MKKTEEIAHIELSLSEAERLVALGKAIERLNKNPDFQKVILDGYFRDEASRLTMLTADITLAPEQRDGVWGGIRGIGELRAYLMKTKIIADTAEKEVLDFKETLDELRQTEDEGEG